MNEKLLSAARAQITGFLQARRKELGYTRIELAELCGFHRNTIANLEDGKFWPNLKQFLIITHHLQCFFFLKEYEADSDYSKGMKDLWEPGNPGSSITGDMQPN